MGKEGCCTLCLVPGRVSVASTMRRTLGERAVWGGAGENGDPFSEESVALLGLWIFFPLRVPFTDFLSVSVSTSLSFITPFKPPGHFCLLRAPPPLSRALPLTLGAASAASIRSEPLWRAARFFNEKRQTQGPGRQFMSLNWEQNENDISEESPHWKK